MSSLVNVEHLNLEFNNLERIEEIQYLKKLKYLNIGNNKIYDNTAILCMSELNDLRDIVIWNNLFRDKKNIYR